MFFWKQNRGLTLVEVMIAISIFSVAVVVSTTILINVVQLEKQNSIQDVLYEDARIIFQQIANEMKNGTVDYDEYYSVNVIQAGELEAEVYYGAFYGAYGSRFFDPGFSLVDSNEQNPKNLGTECTFPTDPDTPPDQCQIQYSLSADLNTGQNPFVYPGMSANMANAFCDVNYGNECDSEINGQPTGLSDELFIIDSTGTKKTIIARKKTTLEGDYGIGVVRMTGSDEDQNGFIDTFTCDPEFSCDGDQDVLQAHMKHLDFVNAGDFSLPSKADLEVPFLNDIGGSHFIPLTPLRSHVKELKFVIGPVDDPYKAYNEPDMQIQPSVMVILTLELSQEAAAEYPGEFEELTLQTTISAGVIGRIDSFPPTSDLSWLDDEVIPDEAYTPSP